MLCVGGIDGLYVGCCIGWFWYYVFEVVWIGVDDGVFWIVEIVFWYFCGWCCIEGGGCIVGVGDSGDVF